MEKLDSFSKILIATGQINYMAASLNSVNEQIKLIPQRLDTMGVHADRVKKNDAILSDAVEKLAEIMEDVAEYLNNIDATCAIDIRVSKVPFEIIAHGMDEVENYYEDETINEA